MELPHWKRSRLVTSNYYSLCHQQSPSVSFFRVTGSLIFLLLLMELGFELRALCLQSRYSITWATPPVHFALVILEMESCELFALASLEPSQVLGLQV
jgi:hypothetical protein